MYENSAYLTAQLNRPHCSRVNSATTTGLCHHIELHFSLETRPKCTPPQICDVGPTSTPVRRLEIEATALTEGAVSILRLNDVVA